MITRIALHVIAPENRERALDLLNRNTAMMRKSKGFVSREVYFSTNDPLTCYCVSTFESHEAWADYFKQPGRPSLTFEGEGQDKRIYEDTPDGRFLLFTRAVIDTFERRDPA
ncbi:MAG: hypothetical protein FJX35_03860 [Alphaproteobacteria bacterium]|nr:hypothetical protein [Alphaproteobacteria bacterium]